MDIINQQDEDEDEDETISENIQMIEINGVKVFISDEELAKLSKLQEAELQEDTSDEDHKDQTYMNI